MGWKVLTWSMSLGQASQALEGAKIPFESKMFYKEGRPYLVLKGAWEGTVYFDESGRISQILFESGSLDDAGAKRAVADAQRRFGPPHETRQPTGDASRSDTVRVWRNPNTLLTMTVAHYSQDGHHIVWECYTPVKKPSPAAPARSSQEPNTPMPLLNQPPTPLIRSDALPVCRSKADIEAHGGALVRLIGTYEIVSMGPYKMAEVMPDGSVKQSSKVVSIALGDGTRVRLGIRPDEEMNRLKGKQVNAVGSLILSPAAAAPEVSQPQSAPTLTEIQSVSVP